MGSITRNFANNLTTSGLLKPAAFNNDSFDNVTAVPSGSVETSDMVFISKATASASASIDFTSGIDSTYKEYVFYFVNMHPSVDSSAFLSFQADTGTNTNYNQTITSTFFKSLQNEAGTTTALSYDTTSDLAQSTNFQHISRNAGYDNDQSVSGTLTIYNPSSSVFVKHFIGTTNVYTDDDYSINSFVGGYFNTTTALTRFRFKFANGNIDSGEILLYGIN